jgi:23S rRNA pseudouridine2457 synthase
MKIVAFFKPYGVVSQFTPLAGHPTLAQFKLPKGVYPCGRLDRDSEGLLLLTDDGALQHTLTDPSYAHPRTYLAQVERVPSPESLARLAGGIALKDGTTKPCKMRLVPEDPRLPPRDPPIRFRKAVPTAWIELVLTEGRNRQVRRMTAAIGHPTLRLIRMSIGTVTLAGLNVGESRPVSYKELKRFSSSIIS